MTEVVVQCDQLCTQLETITVLDVRWELTNTAGTGARHDEYTTAHIPGALFCDLEKHLTSAPGPGGRHPLPNIDRLQETLASWGIGPQSPVVVYDNFRSLAASRAWWCLKWAGVHNVRILDGGWSAWQNQELPVEVGTNEPRPTAVPEAWQADPGMPCVDADQVPHQAVLVDVRAPERYRGDHEPIDPIAGHIPGAINCPITDVLDDNGKFLPATTLRHVMDRFPAGPITGYCGSGITASQFVAAGAIAGKSITLYPGSWSEWITDGKRPIQTGG